MFSLKIWTALAMPPISSRRWAPGTSVSIAPDDKAAMARVKARIGRTTPREISSAARVRSIASSEMPEPAKEVKASISAGAAAAGAELGIHIQHALFYAGRFHLGRLSANLFQPVPWP